MLLPADLLALDPVAAASLRPDDLLDLLRGAALWTPPDLLSQGEAEAEKMSHCIDALLGLRPLEIEAARARSGGRQGLPTALGEAHHSRPWASAATVALLSSPYATLEAVFQVLAPAAGTTVLDLGSGYGRVGFYLALRRPGVRFRGYEVVAERTTEAQRVVRELGLHHLSFCCQDLADPAFVLPCADVYFMYQPVNDATQERLLTQLRVLSRERPITLVACSDPLQEELALLQQSWLTQTHLLRTGTTSRRVVGIFRSSGPACTVEPAV